MTTTTSHKPIIIEKDGWRVTLDPTHPMVVAGQSIDFDWIGVGRGLVEDHAKLTGLDIDAAAAELNVLGSWAILTRSTTPERTAS